MYTCDKGYTMMGASKRVCQTSGQWSGNTPECKHSARFAYFCIFTMIRKTSSSYFCIASKPTPSKSINYECNSQNLILFLCQWSALSILLWIPSHHWAGQSQWTWGTIFLRSGHRAILSVFSRLQAPSRTGRQKMKLNLSRYFVPNSISQFSCLPSQGPDWKIEQNLPTDHRLGT